ncbi:MAG: hypothetical protein ACKOD9_17260, partial [Rubrivivax sp.]
MKSLLKRIGSFLGRCWPRSLTNRVFALYGVTLFAVFGTGLGLFLHYQYQQQVEETQRASVMLIEVVAQAVQDSVVIGDYDTVRKTLDRAVQGSVFESSLFIDTKGGRITVDSRTKSKAQPPAWLVRWADKGVVRRQPQHHGGGAGLRRAAPEVRRQERGGGPVEP